MSPAAVPPLMSSDEVNLLVYSYLAESCLDHSAFTLYSESRLGDFLNSGEDNPPAVPPTGHLIRILQKGLLYLQAEAKYRGEDISANPPRLIGYTIPDTLPLPPIPKSLPPPSPPLASTSAAPTASSTKKRQQPVASSSAAATAALANAASTNLKRKESSKSGDGTANTGSASEDLPGQTQPKKPRMAAKSPTASTSDSTMRETQPAASTSSSTSETARQTSAEAKASPEAAAASTASRNKKGKAKACDTQADTEMSGGEGPLASGSGAVSAAPLANGGSRNGSAKTPSTAPAPVASKPSLPSTNLAASNKYEATGMPDQRRSASPTTTTRKPNGVSNLSKDKNRPRSASPNTSLRSVSNSSNLNSSRSALAMQTPTIDSSKSASASSLPALENLDNGAPTTKQTSTLAPRLEPKHVVKDNEVIVLKGHSMPVQPCHWNPKVETLLATGSGDSTMRIWDVPTEPTGSPVSSTVVCKHSSGQRRSDVTAVEWNRDGSLLASGSEDGIARIWTPSGDLHLVLSMHQRTIFCVKWNNTGSMLLTGSLDHSICLWDTGYGKVKQQWSTHADSILDLDWMTDDIFASCSMDKMINIHQVGRNTPVYRFKGHSDEVNCIRFCPNNRHLASCSDDNTVRVWSLQPVKSLLDLSEKDVQKEGSDESSESKPSGDEGDRPFVVLRGHDKEVHAVAWCPRVTPDSPKLLASASFDATARIWDALTGNCLYIFTRHTDMVYSLAWQTDGNYLATGSNDKKMCVLKVPRTRSSVDRKDDAAQYELALEYEHRGPIYEICWHPMRDQIAVCGKSESVNVVNLDLPKAGITPAP